MAICASVAKLEEYGEGVDLMQVQIEGDEPSFMVGNYANTVEFIGKDVIVTYRKDVYEGQIKTFVNTLTIPVKVSVLDREHKMKLYTRGDDNNSNCCFVDMKDGDVFDGAILYCVSCEFESSAKAVWLTMKVRDRMGRVAKLRLFDYDRNDMDYSGTYIKSTIRKTKYGYNTDEVECIDLEFRPNPEIELCSTYVRNYFSNDAYMRGVLDRTKLIERMEMFVEIEKGYTIVRLASELDILDELKNVLYEVDFRAVSYALVFKYGYVASPKLVSFSENLRSLTFALRQNIPEEIFTKVVQIFDSGEYLPEREIFNKVTALADAIIHIKKEV